MSTTRLTPEQWQTIRAEREAGTSFGELAKRYGISKAGIVQRSTREGWADGQEGKAEARRLARQRAGITEPMTGLTATEAKNAEIDRQAAAGAEVLRRHQGEWKTITKLQAEALDIRHTDPELAFTKAKLAKISAETIAIRQAGERKAYGLDRDDAQQTITIDRGSQVMVYLPANGREAR